MDWRNFHQGFHPEEDEKVLAFDGRDYAVAWVTRCGDEWVWCSFDEDFDWRNVIQWSPFERSPREGEDWL